MVYTIEVVVGGAGFRWWWWWWWWWCLVKWYVNFAPLIAPFPWRTVTSLLQVLSTHLPQTQARACGPCAQAQVSAAQVGDLPLKDAALAVRKLTHSLRLHLFQPFLNHLTVLFLFPSRGRDGGIPPPPSPTTIWLGGIEVVNDNHRT